MGGPQTLRALREAAGGGRNAGAIVRLQQFRCVAVLLPIVWQLRALRDRRSGRLAVRGRHLGPTRLRSGRRGGRGGDGRGHSCGTHHFQQMDHRDVRP